MARRLAWLGLWCSALLAVCMPLQAQVRSYDSIVESGVLKVALYQDFAPYSFQQDGKSRGVDYEVAEALAAGLGLRLEVIWAPPGEKLDDDLRDYIWRGHYLRPHELADVMLRVPYDREFSYKSNEFGELVNEHAVALVGWHPSTRGVGSHDKLFILENCHVVSNGGRRNSESVPFN